MTRPQFMTNLSRKLRHRRMRRRDSPRRSWSDRVSLFTHNLTRPLRHRRRKRLNSPRQSWFERLELLTHNLTRPLRHRRMKRLNSPGSGWAARLELLTHNLTRPLRHRRRKRLASPESGWAARLELITYNLSRPLRRRRQKRLASPESRWTVKLSQLLRHLTRPVRRVLRVWLRPLRRKWTNRSLSQRTSYGLLALGVVIVVVGAAVILPNLERPDQQTATASGGASPSEGRTEPTSPDVTDAQNAPTALCGDPAIWAIVDQALPGAEPGSVLCSVQWMAIRLSIDDPTSPLTAYLGANGEESWSLVGVSDQAGNTVVGDLSPVPRHVLTASAEMK
jgi:hypothetical protein